jgi:hypothetical protein
VSSGQPVSMFGLNGDWRLSARRGSARAARARGGGSSCPLTRGRRTPRSSKGDPFEDVEGGARCHHHHDQEHGSTLHRDASSHDRPGDIPERSLPTLCCTLRTSETVTLPETV